MVSLTGSSPLARGTHTPRWGGAQADRFIPARAGNTACSRSPPASPPVHPRSRGEHETREPDPTRTIGSSPLARGTHLAPRHHRVPQRFIPARAGNTFRHQCGSRARTVHPRSRGEHEGTRVGLRVKTGSSPLARGTLNDRSFSHPVERFIPARAGNTPCSRCRWLSAPVHPRSRGEHVSPNGANGLVPGSSPLARGTRRLVRRDLAIGRFIPARAGNTGSISTFGIVTTVHPRSRGEHRGGRAARLRQGGSSPLARGTRTRPRLSRPSRRFIPARAGNTAWSRTGR